MYLNSDLDITNFDNTVEVGFFYGSPLDLNSDELNLFGEFIFKTNNDYF